MKKNSGMSFLLVGILVVGIITGLFAVINARVQANNTLYAFTDVGVWHVTDGDTIWSIAEEHSDGRFEIRRVMEDIYKLNGMTDCTIYAGQTIDVPLYDNMDWTYHNEEDEGNFEISLDRIEEGRWAVVEVYDKRTGEIEMHDVDLQKK